MMEAVFRKGHGENMTEPSYEELKAKVAELEKQSSRRRTGSLEFRVSEKGAFNLALDPNTKDRC